MAMLEVSTPMVIVANMVQMLNEPYISSAKSRAVACLAGA